MTRLSNEERRAVIERFFEKVSEGTQIDEQWKRDMIDASAPELPETPTPEQLDAWIELSEIVSDPTFVASMRESAMRTWTGEVDMAAATRASEEAIASTAAHGREPDGAFRSEMHAEFGLQDPRARRYWELVAIINDAPEIAQRTEEWGWLVSAVAHHLRP